MFPLQRLDSLHADGVFALVKSVIATVTFFDIEIEGVPGAIDREIVNVWVSNETQRPLLLSYVHRRNVPVC